MSPSTDRPGWRLESAVERECRFPGQLALPDEPARASLAPGDVAQLLFLIDDPNGAGPKRCERMWVKLSRLEAGGYRGDLFSVPRSAGAPLKAGALISFGPEHVAAILDWSPAPPSLPPFDAASLPGRCLELLRAVWIDQRRFRERIRPHLLRWPATPGAWRAVVATAFGSALGLAAATGALAAAAGIGVSWPTLFIAPTLLLALAWLFGRRRSGPANFVTDGPVMAAIGTVIGIAVAGGARISPDALTPWENIGILAAAGLAGVAGGICVGVGVAADDDRFDAGHARLQAMAGLGALGIVAVSLLVSDNTWQPFGFAALGAQWLSTGVGHALGGRWAARQLPWAGSRLAEIIHQPPDAATRDR